MVTGRASPDRSLPVRVRCGEVPVGQGVRWTKVLRRGSCFGRSVSSCGRLDRPDGGSLMSKGRGSSQGLVLLRPEAGDETVRSYGVGRSLSCDAEGIEIRAPSAKNVR